MVDPTRIASQTTENIASEEFEMKEPKHVMMVDQLWLWLLDDRE